MRKKHVVVDWRKPFFNYVKSLKEIVSIKEPSMVLLLSMLPFCLVLFFCSYNCVKRKRTPEWKGLLRNIQRVLIENCQRLSLRLPIYLSVGVFVLILRCTDEEQPQALNNKRLFNPLMH